jgi:hypothetical protein
MSEDITLTLFGIIPPNPDCARFGTFSEIYSYLTGAFEGLEVSLFKIIQLKDGVTLSSFYQKQQFESFFQKEIIACEIELAKKRLQELQNKHNEMKY